MFATLALLASVYGVTLHGGTADRGTAFVVGKDGPQTIYSFCSLANCYDGANPVGITQMRDGSFIGTTANGGVRDNGVLFKLVPSATGWQETVLYTFGRLFNDDDGRHPLGCLTVTNGWITGIADGGYYGDGIVWKFKTFHWGGSLDIQNFRQPWISHDMRGACADAARKAK